MATSSSNTFATPPMRDLQRAILCCACSYRRRCSKEELATYAHSVHLTTLLYGERSLYRMVLAIAADDHKRTLFVALPGSQTFRDWLVNLDVRHKHLRRGLGMFQGAVEGLYHSGFVSRLQEMLPDMARLADYMSKESIDRLVFCGHSLGGALAHIALIRFFIHNGLDVGSCQHISIAFGPPKFCDDAAARYLDGQHLGLGKRMFTYVKQDDPVPHLLNDFQSARSAAIRFLLKQGGKRMKAINWCPQRTVDSNRNPHNAGANLLPAFHHHQDFGLFWVALFSVLQFGGTAPRYAHAGKFFVLPEERADASPPQLEPIPIRPEDLPTSGVRTINSDAIQRHTTGAYLRLCQVRAGQSPEGRVVRPKSIYPHITSAKFNFKGKVHEELKEAHIFIRGQNLFLPLRCRVQGPNWSCGDRGRRLMEGVGWEIHSCDHVHSRIVLELRQKVSLAMVSSLSKCKFRVSITTCFGKSNECPVTVPRPTFDSLIQAKASRSISRLLLLKSCGFSEELDRCELVLKDAFCKGISHLNEQGQNFLNELEYMPQGLHEKMSRTREELVDPLVAELTSDIDMSKRAITACSAPGNEVVGSDARGLRLSDKKASTYNKQLAYLVQCFTDDETNAEPPSRRQTRASSFYEEKLYMLLREKPDLLEMGQINDRMMRDILPQDVRERLLQKAQVLRCIWQVNELLEKEKVVIFVGPEFAGKSELIECLMESAEVYYDEAGKQQRPMKRPEHGVKGSVQCCKMMGDVGAVLVEVPGNVRRRGRFERWPDLEHVADLCVVVVSYAGDTREAAKEWAAEARQLSGCRNLLMVVNGADRVLHGREGARVWEEVTKDEVRSDYLMFAAAAGLPPECVFMAVARPPHELEPTTLVLLQERNILLRPDITGQLRARIAAIQAAPKLALPLSSPTSIR